MNVIFKKIRYKNILSTGNLFTEIDLRRNKTTLISGSNGAGKCVRGDTNILVFVPSLMIAEQLFEGHQHFTTTVKSIVDLYQSRKDLIGQIQVNTRYGFKTIEWADVTARHSQVITITSEYGDEISVSPDHKLLTSSGEWVNAKSVKLDTVLMTIYGPVQIDMIYWEPDREDLYDLQVAEVQEYFTNGFVSHNSTMIEALVFGLYNKPFRKVNKPQLMNSVNEKELIVEIEFSAAGSNYVVKRGIKPTVFEIWKDGTMLNKDAAARDYQEYLEKNILKMSMKSFTQIVVLGSATYVPFMDLPAAARREIIEDLLDIQIFSTMNLLVKDEIAENKEILKELAHTIDIKKLKIEAIEQEIRSIQSVKQVEVDKIKDKVVLILNDIETKRAQKEQLEEQIASLYNSIDDKQKIKEKLADAKDIKSELQYKQRELQKELSFYDNHDNCPTCKQGIEHDFKQMVISNRSDDDQKLAKGISAIDQKIISFEKRMEEISIVEDNIRDLQSEISSLQSEVKLLKSTLMTYKSELDQAEQEIKTVDTTVLDSLKEELGKAEQEQLDAYETREVLSTASLMLKDGGIKTKILRQYIPVMNKLINKYLALFDLYVDFQLDENFNETIKSRFRDAFSYSSFSEGEKMRINLSILMSWRAIAKMRNSVSTNLWLLDEILDGPSDASGVDSLLAILKEIGDNDNIFVISHRGETFSDKFDGHINFKKTGNFSECEVIQ